MIKNIVFDIGNVLTDFRYRGFLADKGLDEAMIDRIEKCTVDTPYWHEFDRCAISYDEVVENFVSLDPEIGDAKYDELLTAYKEKENATEYTYVDPFGDTPDMPSLTTIGVKWNESDTPEVKLEKIITQKYIALYPNSYEAWAELRRTGYPRVFPVLNPWEGDESLDDGDMIRRMPFPGRDDPSTNNDIINTGIPALGGPDVQAFRLWWDLPGGNF